MCIKYHHSQLGIIGLMAATPQGIIGYNNQLPWYYPDELNHFRKTIKDAKLIMGRKTFDNIPKDVINDNHCIVFSKRQIQALGATLVDSLQSFLDLITKLEFEEKKIMIGGGQIANLFLKHNLISQFVLTKIHKSYVGDVYLNLEYLAHWRKKKLSQNDDYTIYLYDNVY